MPGRTNRLLARLVSRIAITFPEAARFFPSGKTIVTGLPIRPEIAASTARQLVRLSASIRRDAARRQPGSAHDQPGDAGRAGGVGKGLTLQVLHQIGKGSFADWEPEPGPAGPPGITLFPISTRSRTPTRPRTSSCAAPEPRPLAEITAAGLPAILVPYPFAMADHQTL